MFRLCFSLLLVLQAVTARGDEAAGPVSFREQVAPILVKSCLGCHHAKKAEGGLNMATFALLKKGGESGGELILEPGNPESSQLIELIRPGAAPRMPYKQPPLSDVQIKTLERWVKEGAKFDGGSETETPIASLVDPLRGLPNIALTAPVAEALTSLAYSPDGKWLAAAAGRSVLLFGAEAGNLEATLAGHPGLLTTVRISPDGRTLVAAGGRPGIHGSFTVWDLATKVKRYEIQGHKDSILSAAIAPDGKVLATASYDREIKLWDLDEGNEIRTLKDHTDAVYSVAFAPSGTMLASAGADRTVKLWDLTSGRRLKTLSDATAELYTVTFGPGGETVLAGGVDRSIHRWRVSDQDASLVNSVFAHDAAVLRLVVSADGKTLVSSGEDYDVKLWDLPALTTRKALSGQADWPQGLALSPDGLRVAVGRFDGSLSVYEAATGQLIVTMNPPAAAVAPAKPQLVRNATLNPLSPRSAVRGTSLRAVLTGTGVGNATSIVFVEPGLTGTIVRAAKPDPNRLEVDLVVAADARVGTHRLGLITPLGVPAFQSLIIVAHPEITELDPKDEALGSKSVSLPATLTGVIDQPGDVDRFRFEAKAGDQILFEIQAKALGSPLLGLLTVEDDAGQVLGESAPADGAGDPWLNVAIPRDGNFTLKVTDADYAGTPGHFYRIRAGRLPYLTDLFPLGVERGLRSSIQVEGTNLQGLSTVTMTTEAVAELGSMPAVAVVLPDGTSPLNRRTVIVAEGRQGVESADNDRADRAELIAVPGGISGRIEQGGDVDHFRFTAKKGERLILEVFGRRLGTSIDPVLEVLDEQGMPVPQAVLRPLEQTEVAFREHDSSKPGIRLTRWGNLAVGDYVLIGRELTRIRSLPRNPDDDCTFWNERNQRVGFLGTTPEHHPMLQPIYKVSIHPPGTHFPPGGVAPVTLTYRNDDGGPDSLKDSRLTFDPPADGVYVVRVEDVRGLGGKTFGYHLVVRKPRPRFQLALSTENPSVPRGGTTLVTATIARLDGFDGPVDLTVDRLPAGLTATAARIEPDAFSASIGLSADPFAPAYSPPTWRVTGRAKPALGSNSEPGEWVQVVDPGGPAGGWIVVSPEPNLTVEAAPTQVVIQPGQEISIRLTVKRADQFTGRVPIEVRNLPAGVRVLNIGLNGVLITEKQSERTISLYAEPWASATERPFYAVGKAEAAGTEHSSAPIDLIVGPGGGTSPVTSAAKPR
ncbi:WD domain-containing protein, G-beta repeat-containing protein [Singulisphaera sp. GP187]|uniref:c-type cytochrome domain-containing protein n=1 Tax=Singulisphaera sp. GP187 TaxID=1882752 RepID=UPI00092BC7FE|nr:c-type cytochrome domain-containing protein [Singulisphaera sp. GP187]SIO67681.1 WD domain-containing protein, G-beta repeat-containing protein [Singulisphaera sp. GP187]